MDVGIVKVAEDKDFEKLKQLYDDNNDWRLDYNKPDISVWTKSVPKISFRMVKIKTRFPDVMPETLYDVLQDPFYREVWDSHMISSKDIGYFNPNNDIGYYAMACPAPMKNRDFVLQRSWLDTGNEQLILNHSVFHKDYPPMKQFIRATSYLTGYIVRPSLNGNGSELGYVSHTDPHGKLPVWLVNKVTQIFAPKLVKKLHKASVGYPEWKLTHNPNLKPWHFPEQISSPRIQLEDCTIAVGDIHTKLSLTEPELTESMFQLWLQNNPDSRKDSEDEPGTSGSSEMKHCSTSSFEMLKAKDEEGVECVKSVEEKNSKNSFVDESELKEAPSKEVTITDSD